MAKKSTKPATRHVKPEDENQDNEGQEAVEATEPDEEAPRARRGRTSAGNGSISKVDAVRRALAAGKQLPEEGVSYIEEQFGIEMDRQHFSSVKSQLKKKEGGGEVPEGKLGRKPKAAASQGVEGYLAPPPKPAPAGGSELLDAMEAMKPLVASLGKEQVKRIVDLLG